MANITRKRTGELLRILFGVLKDNPEGIKAKEAIEQVKSKTTLSEYEEGTYSNGGSRFDKILRFATIDCVKSGWLIKQKGIWTITEDGIEAYDSLTDPDKFYKKAVHLYRKWKSNHKAQTSQDIDDEEDKETSITFEQAEELAWSEISDHLQNMNPYEFQYLVADLLKALGYHSAWVAPPGKDGGVDIVAYNDPLGATMPRLKVQVKRTKDKISVDGLRSFLAVLGDDDVGIFVCTGGFTKDAQKEARTQEKRKITLIDLQLLFDLWTEHYNQLEEAAKRRLPLRPIYFLAPE